MKTDNKGSSYKLLIPSRPKKQKHLLTTSKLPYSRQIESISYDQEKGLLSIIFAGKTQDHYEVPSKVYRKLKSSKNQDEYYHENVYGNYPIISTAADENHRACLKDQHNE
jgi:hypothetical protein